MIKADMHMQVHMQQDGMKLRKFLIVIIVMLLLLRIVKQKHRQRFMLDQEKSTLISKMRSTMRPTGTESLYTMEHTMKI